MAPRIELFGSDPSPLRGIGAVGQAQQLGESDRFGIEGLERRDCHA